MKLLPVVGVALSLRGARSRRRRGRRKAARGRKTTLTAPAGENRRRGPPWRFPSGLAHGVNRLRILPAKAR